MQRPGLQSTHPPLLVWLLHWNSFGTAWLSPQAPLKLQGQWNEPIASCVPSAASQRSAWASKGGRQLWPSMQDKLESLVMSL